MLRTTCIVDPGLIFKNGHHRDFNINIAAALPKGSAPTKIFVHKKYQLSAEDLALENVEIIPFFSNGPYDHIGVSGTDPIEYHKDLAKTFLSEIAAIANEYNIILPTVFPYLLGVLSKINDDIGNISAVVHHDAELYKEIHNREEWLSAFSLVAGTKNRIRIYSVEEALKEKFQKLAGPSVRLRSAPFPTRVNLFPPASRNQGYPSIGMIGAQHRFQGNMYQEQAISVALECGFRVILQDTSKEPGHFGVISIYGIVEDFKELITKCSVIFLHYDPEMYKKMGSGVYWETLSCGVPVITTMNTVPSKNVAKYKNGSIIRYGDLDQFKSVLREFRSSYEKFSSAADKARMLALKEIGPKKFVDAVVWWE